MLQSGAGRNNSGIIMDMINSVKNIVVNTSNNGSSQNCCIPSKFFLIVEKMKCIFEPRHEKTGSLHMRKQRLRSASL